MQVAVPPGFEPRQTDPESVVLPLHHRTIFSRCKGKKICVLEQIFFRNDFSVESIGKCIVRKFVEFCFHCPAFNLH